MGEKKSPVEGPDYRVLVIDDHPLLATAVSMELQTRGNVACQIVHTGEEAVAAYVAADQSETAADAFDLVLSDMDLDEAPDSVGRVLARSFWGGGSDGECAPVVELRPRAISRRRRASPLGDVEA